MKSWLRSSKEFDIAYSRVEEFVRENINPYVDTLELSENTKCDYCFPITDDRLFVIGLDKTNLTIWVFFDDDLADV